MDQDKNNETFLDERRGMCVNPTMANKMLVAIWASIITRSVVGRMEWDRVSMRFDRSFDNEPSELHAIAAACAVILHDTFHLTHDSYKLCMLIGEAILDEGCPDFSCKDLVQEVVKEFYANQNQA